VPLYWLGMQLELALQNWQKKIAVLSIGFGLVTWGLVALIAAVSSDDYGRNLAGFGACYYLIMLPSAILLTFAFNVGVEGL